MSIREGMRRLTIAFWWLTAVPMFVIVSADHNWTPVAVGMAIGYTSVYAGAYWGFVALVRWIWLGFASPPPRK